MNKKRLFFYCFMHSLCFFLKVTVGEKIYQFAVSQNRHCQHFHRQSNALLLFSQMHIHQFLFYFFYFWFQILFLFTFNFSTVLTVYLWNFNNEKTNFFYSFYNSILNFTPLRYKVVFRKKQQQQWSLFFSTKYSFFV